MNAQAQRSGSFSMDGRTGSHVQGKHLHPRYPPFQHSSPSIHCLGLDSSKGLNAQRNRRVLKHLVPLLPWTLDKAYRKFWSGPYKYGSVSGSQTSIQNSVCEMGSEAPWRSVLPSSKFGNNRLDSQLFFHNRGLLEHLCLKYVKLGVKEEEYKHTIVTSLLYFGSPGGGGMCESHLSSSEDLYCSTSLGNADLAGIFTDFGIWVCISDLVEGQTHNDLSYN